MFLQVFLAYFALFSGQTESLMRTRAKKEMAAAKHKQTERRRAGREWGPAAGARVSAATQRTRTSDSGTDVCTTLSPRHGNVMADASGKGGSERDDSTVTMKPELNRFRV
jgi:hypothetical protein